MASGYFQRLRDEGRSFYQKLSRSQRWMIGGGGALALSAVIAAALWLQQPNWNTLYADLSAKDAGQIVAWLKENKVPYQLNSVGDGASIEVPANQVHELRLQMAAQDLPREGGVIGMELFDQEKLGMTNRVFDLNYQRALAGELSRTIMQIDGVDRARVHLAIPKKQIFTELQEPATASVNLKLSPVARLDEAQVKGIAKLVAGSVPGLEQKNVTITDGEGNLLFDAETAEGKQNGTILNQEQLALQKQVESEIRGNVEQILGKVVGRDHVTVQVKALLDFDSEESVSKTYTPNNNRDEDANTRVLRSEKVVKETGAGTEAVAGGVPGVTSNDPGQPTYQGRENDSKASYGREDTTRNYEVPETQTTKVKDLGQVKKLSLSVAIDSLSPAINSPEGLDANDPYLVNLRNLAEKAAGLDLADRRDTIAIYALPFDKTESDKQQAADAQAERMEFWSQVLMLGLLGLVVLLVLVGLLILWLRRRRLVEAETFEDAAAAFLPGEEMLPQLEAPSDPEFQEASMRRQATVRTLSDLAKDDPAKMARLLRVWMQEG